MNPIFLKSVFIRMQIPKKCDLEIQLLLRFLEIDKKCGVKEKKSNSYKQSRRVVVRGKGEILIIIKVYIIHIIIHIIFYILCFHSMRYFEDIYIAAHTDLLCFKKVSGTSLHE